MHPTYPNAHLLINHDMKSILCIGDIVCKGPIHPMHTIQLALIWNLKFGLSAEIFYEIILNSEAPPVKLNSLLLSIVEKSLRITIFSGHRRG